MMWTKLLKPHSLGDFLNDTFMLVPKLWKRALPVSVFALLPGVAAWMAVIGSIASWLKGIAADPIPGEAVTGVGRILSGLGPLLLLVAAATVLLSLGQAFQKAFVCAQVGAVIEGRRAGFSELLSEAFRPAWIRVAVQDAALGSIAGGIVMALVAILTFPLAIGALGDLVGAGGPHAAGFAPGFVIRIVGIYLASLAAGLAVVWWLRVRTCACAPAAVLEHANSFSGIGRSLDLSRNRGWRIFGVMFIVSLVITFGLGIVTGPFTFAVAMPGYFGLLRSTLSGEKPSPDTVAAFLASLSWGAGLSMLVSGVIKGGLWPSFLTLLYTDLRIRAGEIDVADEAPAAPAAQPDDFAAVPADLAAAQPADSAELDAPLDVPRGSEGPASGGDRA
jgi:hypothetical protein